MHKPSYACKRRCHSRTSAYADTLPADRPAGSLACQP
jgi:hypothetical protein